MYLGTLAVVGVWESAQGLLKKINKQESGDMCGAHGNVFEPEVEMEICNRVKRVQELKEESIQPKGKTNGRKGKVQEPMLGKECGVLPPVDEERRWPASGPIQRAPPLPPPPTLHHLQLQLPLALRQPDKNIWQPSPIQEEDDNVQMLDDTVDVTGAQQQQAPLASANDFPPDHWIKPDNDKLPPPPPTPAMASEDNIWFSLLPAIHNLSSPAMPSRPGQSTWYPLSHDQMEAMLAQIHFEMEELCTCDQLEIDFWQDCLQHHMDLAEASDSAMSIGDSSLSAPPNAFACTVTNNMFTLDVSWMGAQTGGDTFGDTADGSPVARHNRVSSTPTIIPPLTMREYGLSVSLVGAPPVQSPVLLVARPSSVPANAQFILAPLSCQQYGLLSHQGQSPSGDGTQ
ncbi:hypothetical protein EDB19DRAFT_1837347 [Suillus lakei]|nr:hypothetical protein EDB19DRAFT_1837347 [Suillus lakei]